MKYKIGDKVKVISKGDCYNNQIGIIININNSSISRWKYSVKFDVNFNDTNFIGVYEESELQLIKPNTKKVKKYKHTRKKAIKQIYKQPLFTLDKSELMSLISNIEKDLLAQKEDRKGWIPCNCPKGGIDGDGMVCDKCGGTEWVKVKPTPSPLELPKINNNFISMEQYNWAKQITDEVNKLYQLIKEKL